MQEYAPWQFKPGGPGGPGRPKGVHNAAKAILKAAPLLAKSYIKRAAKSDAICIDARKWILPTDEDRALLPPSQLTIVFTGNGHALTLSDEADGSQRRVIEADARPMLDADASATTVTPRPAEPSA